MDDGDGYTNVDVFSLWKTVRLEMIGMVDFMYAYFATVRERVMLIME